MYEYYLLLHSISLLMENQIALINLYKNLLGTCDSKIKACMEN